ncbi:hypothetical protein H4W32_009070 [Actinophytocola algeriensis]|uniref:Uncharacterized protein n=1 Tax=Actinophytocola algeriensis TaxID=1768010 RepID=A0A7W7QF82_9PSEU|nr:hypothetical protein [Actinophytocola algeriensis]MBE1481028.1 hypothetical protein [Actinophytocola algeriensis]
MSSNASGMASASRNIAAMATSMVTRAMPSSALTRFDTHE